MHNFDVESWRSLHHIHSQLDYIKKTISEQPYVVSWGTEIERRKQMQGWRGQKQKEKRKKKKIWVEPRLNGKFSLLWPRQSWIQLEVRYCSNTLNKVVDNIR